ncbi:MAG: cadherin-like domain-containing protein [Reyranellaceae bacterium]
MTTYWTTGETGDWSDELKWQSGIAPTSADAAVINGSTVTVLGAGLASSLALNNATLTVDGSLSITTTLYVNSSSLHLEGGTLVAQTIDGGNGTYSSIYGYGTIQAAGVGDVTITASGGLLTVLSPQGGGGFGISEGAILELAAGVSTWVSFSANATLKLDAPSTFVGRIINMSIGDTIDLVGVLASSASYDGTTLTVNIVGGGQLHYQVGGSVVGNALNLVSDNNGGTAVSWVQPAESWIVGATGDWSDGSKWQSGVAPTSADAAVINGSTVTVLGAGLASSLALNNATLTVDGSLSIATTLYVNSSNLHLEGGTLVAQTIDGGNGTYSSIYGYGTITAAGVGDVTITASDGLLKVLGSQGWGGFGIGEGAMLELAAGVSSWVSFSANATLKLDAPSTFVGRIINMSIGDTIDLVGVLASSASYDGTTLTVNVAGGGQLHYQVGGSVTGNVLNLVSDNNGGTAVFWGEGGPPTASVSLSAASFNAAGNSGIVTFTFSRAISDFGLATDVTVTGGTLSNLATHDGGRSYTALFTATPNVDASLGSISVLAGSYHAGGMDGSGASATFTVDTSAPTVAVALSHDTGSSSTDRITSDARLVGSGDANASVTLTEGNTTLGTTKADGTGQWSFTPTGLIDGAHTIVASQTDAAGNTGSASIALTLDTTAPRLTGMTASDAVLSKAGVVHFTATFSEAVEGVDASAFGLVTSGLSGAGITSVEAVAGSGGTQYTVTAATGPGEGTLQLQFLGTSVHDQAGNGLPGGSFSAPSVYSVGSSPLFVTVGDLNGDGRMDIAAANYGSGSVSLLFGNGDGTFQTPATSIGSSGMYFVTSGDLNGDGLQDLVLDNRGAQSLSILLATGNGNFVQSASVPTGLGSNGVVIADVNGDTKPDLVATSPGTNALLVFQGRGDGTFQSPSSYSTGAFPNTAAAADLNGDGKIDLVSANYMGASVSVLLGNGDGTFKAQTAYAALGPNTFAVAVGDLNGDGRPDLVASNYSGSGDSLSVLLGNGDGTFQEQVAYNTGLWPTAVSVVDVDGDGKRDLVAANYNGNVSVLLGKGDGTFQPQIVYGAGDHLNWMAVGDFDGNGKADIVVANSADSAISVLLNTPPVQAGPTYTIDRTAPLAPTIVSIAENAGGGISAGEASNGTPVVVALGGTHAAMGDVLTVSWGSRSVTYTLTSSDNVFGNVTVAIPVTTIAAQGDGSFGVTAKLTDAAGNVGAASASFAVTVDTVAPGAPSIVSVAENAAGGISAAEASDGTPVVVGLVGTGAVAGDSLTLSWGGQGVGYLLVGADIAAGRATIAVPAALIAAQGNGTFNLITKLTDAAGNAGPPSASFAVTVDTVAPGAPSIVSVVENAGGGISAAEVSDGTPVIVNLSGTGALVGDLVTLGWGSQNVGYAVTSSDIADGRATIVVPAATIAAQGDGSFGVTAKLTDAAGNAGAASASFAVAVDTAAPGAPSIVSVVENAGGGINAVEASDGTPVVVGLAGTGAAVGDSVTLSWGGQSVGYVLTGDDISAGQATIVVSASQIVTQGDGTLGVTAKLTDAAGNSGAVSTSFAVTVDTAAPGAPSIVSVVENAGGGINAFEASDGAPVVVGLAGTGAMAGDAVTVKWRSATVVYILSAGDIAAGSVSVGVPAATIQAEGDGAFGVTATTTDAVGNSSPASAPFAVVVDTSPPQNPVFGTIGGADNKVTSQNGDATVLGTAEAGSTIALSFGNSLLGTATADAGGAWSYLLSLANVTAIGQGAGKTLTATATDAAGNISAVATSGLFTVQWTNHAPVVSGPVAGAANEDGSGVTLNALANASDVDVGTILTVINVPATLPAGVVYDAGTHLFRLDPAEAAYQSLAQGQSKIVTVKYGVSDGFTSTAASVQWTVTGSNDAPGVSGPVTGNAKEDGAVSKLNALANASDVDAGTTLAVVNVPTVLPAGVSYDAGTRLFSLDASAAAYQSLAAGQTTTVTVGYGVSDGIVTTAASVQWTVTGVNDAPVVSGTVLATVAEDGAPSVLDALANASDVDAGTTLTVVNVPATLPAGVVYDAGTHLFRLDPADAAYQPLAQGQSKIVTVKYGVSDGTSTTSASVQWTVNGTNDAPVVSGPVTGSVKEDGAVSNLNALAKASDVDAGTTLAVVNVPADLPPGVSYDAGTRLFSLDASAAAYQSLAAGQTTTVTVGYDVSDGIVTTAASVQWTVTGVNDAPVVSGTVLATVAEDGAPSVLDALANASDADAGTTLTVVNVPATLPAGVVYDAGTHLFRLDPADAAYQSLAQGQSKIVTVKYGVSDGTSTTSASVQWTVNGVNDAPVVSGPVTGSVKEDGAVSNLNALAKASDVDAGTTLAVVNVPADLPAGVSYDAGTRLFSLDASAAAYQSLAAGQTTTVTVGYGVSDGIVTTAASVQWTVTGVNDAPVVSGTVLATVAEDGAPSELDALANASDVDAGTTLTVVNVPATLPAGVVYDAGTHLFRLDPADAAYQPLAQGQSKIVTVKYGVSDGTSTTSALVQWTVTGVNDAPVVSGFATGSTKEDGAISKVNALAKASDIDAGTTLTVLHVPAATQAGITYDPATHMFSLDPSAAVYQSLPAGRVTSVAVTYIVSDGIDETSATAEWTVTGVNDAPVVTGAVLGTASEDGAPSELNALANASDIDAGTTLVAVNLPAALPSGVLYDDATHLFRLDPTDAAYQSLAQGQSKLVTVKYGVSDGASTIAASAQWTVTGTNDAPEVSGPVTGSAKEDGAVSKLNALAKASDIDAGASLSVAGVPASLPAGVTWDADTHTFSLDPKNAVYQALAPGESTTVTVGYDVSDGAATTPGSVEWTVTGINHAPKVVGRVRASVTEDGAPSTLDALANATDVDPGQTLSVVNVQASLPAGVTYDAPTHTFRLDPGDAAYQSLAKGQVLRVTVTYDVSDGTATTADSVRWRLTGINDAPVVTGAVTDGAIQGGAVSVLDALANASDIDGGTVLTVVNVPGMLPGGVTYDAATHSFSLDPSNAAYQALAPGQSTTVSVAYGVSDGIVTVSGSVQWNVSAPVVISDGIVTRVSTAATGAQANGVSYGPVFSPDGMKVGFVSIASNLVADVTNGAYHVFVKDLATGQVLNVSADAGGVQANGNSFGLAFSSDGQTVAFQSDASNLVPDDTNGAGDVFVKNLTTGAITRASTDAAGTQANGYSYLPVFSPDGTKIAFYSSASNLVPGDINGHYDVFVKDLATGAVTLVSTDAAGSPSNGDSDSTPVFSPDGTKLVFGSAASNLIPEDTNGTWDLFLKDLLTGDVTRLSTDSSGVQVNAPSFDAVFSPDGTRVAFASYATDLVSGISNGRANVFVKDLASGSVVCISTDAAGGETDADSWTPTFSQDGSKVVFRSFATNLVSGDTNGASDLFVKDLTTGAIALVSTSSSGAPANNGSYAPVFSPDGTRLAFESDASNLIAGDTNAAFDVFVKLVSLVSISSNAYQWEGRSGITSSFTFEVTRWGDSSLTQSATWTLTGSGDHPADAADFGGTLPSGTVTFAPGEITKTIAIGVTGDTDIEFDEGFMVTLSAPTAGLMLLAGQANGMISNDDATVFGPEDHIVRVSVDATGAQANDSSQQPVISADGTKVAFISFATNLVSGDTNSQADIFVKDLATGQIMHASTSASGAQANNASFDPALSPDGSKVAFGSAASNLVPDDTNGWDIFVKDLVTGVIERVSTDGAGNQANSVSWGAVFSPDGTKISFTSAASNLVPDDTNGVADIFIKNLATGEIVRISTDGAGAQADNESFGPAFSADGNKVGFVSYASNLVPDDTNQAFDIFVKDLTSGSIERVSTDSNGGQANGFSPSSTDGRPAIGFSPEGTKVVYQSGATNLVPDDTNGVGDIFVKDLVTGETTRISLDATGGQANDISIDPVWVSGTKVAFVSAASNLVADDVNSFYDVFVKDLTTGAITRLPVDGTGIQPSFGWTWAPSFSADGALFAFGSSATNLVRDDTNGDFDVFVQLIGIS